MRTIILKGYISANQLAEESHCVLETVVLLGPEGPVLSNIPRFSLTLPLYRNPSVVFIFHTWCSCACSYCLWHKACSFLLQAVSWSWWQCIHLYHLPPWHFYSLSPLFCYLKGSCREKSIQPLQIAGMWMNPFLTLTTCVTFSRITCVMESDRSGPNLKSSTYLLWKLGKMAYLSKIYFPQLQMGIMLIAFIIP